MGMEMEIAKALIASHSELGDEAPAPLALDMKPLHEFYGAILAEKTEQLRLQSTIISTLCTQLHKANASIAHLSNQNLQNKSRLQTYSEQEEIHLKKIEELEEENGAHLDTINTLIAAERKQQDTIRSAEAQAVAFIRAARKCKWAGPAMLGTLAIKNMGAICSVEWERAYKKQFGRKARWRLGCDNSLIAWQELIQNSEWHPFKVVEVDGTATSCMDGDDPLLKHLLETWGKQLYGVVVKALTEMETYNASGRYPTPVLWDGGCKEPLELADFIGKLSGNFVVLDEMVGKDLHQECEVHRITSHLWAYM